MCGRRPGERDQHGLSVRLEAAHVIGRTHDAVAPAGQPGADPSTLWVDPRAIVPLCAPNGCHAAYDLRRITLAPFLRADELDHAIELVGVASALRRIG